MGYKVSPDDPSPLELEDEDDEWAEAFGGGLDGDLRREQEAYEDDVAELHAIEDRRDAAAEFDDLSDDKKIRSMR